MFDHVGMPGVDHLLVGTPGGLDVALLPLENLTKEH